jgi:hypothetical protein
VLGSKVDSMDGYHMIFEIYQMGENQAIKLEHRMATRYRLVC